jgi:hypothetical protein
MDDFYCDYCSRTFSCKTALDKHISLCEIYFAAKYKKQNDLDSYEPEMTNRERDTLLRHLVYKIKVLTDKVNKQQSEITYLKERKKLTALNYLNSLEVKPAHTFQQWVKSLTVSRRHLEIVFQKSLKDGILEVLTKELEVLKIFQTISPVKGYFQRPNLLYVYAESEQTNTTRWVKLENSMLKTLCSFIGYRFYELYSEWQKENEYEINDSAAMQEKDMMYLQKVLDESYKVGTSLNSIVEGMYNVVKTNFQTIEFD